MKRQKSAKESILSPLSHYSSRKEWEIASWQVILRSPRTLDVLITPYERHGLVMRAAVVDGIRSGKSYKEIGNKLWCSPQTISAIKKALNENKYRSYRERGKTERKKKIYSSSGVRKQEPRGRGVHTKYGIVRLP